MSSHRCPSIELLQALAGQAAFARGVDYARKGAVEVMRAETGGVSAIAHGTGSYLVRVDREGEGLKGRCDCPVGETQGFCKHQVAATLLWMGADLDVLATTVEPRKPKSAKRGSRVSAAEAPGAALGRWLQTLPAEDLRELVMSIATQHAEVGTLLTARARLAGGSRADQRKAVSELIGRKRFLDYRACVAHARKLGALTNLLRERLEHDPAQALDLADYALHRLISQYHDSDDSSGALGEVVREVGALHSAAAAHLSDVDGLAKAWVKLKAIDDWGVVGDLDVFADAIGKRGIAWIEAHASARLDELPPSRSVSDRWQEAGLERQLMLSLFKQTSRHGGDVDAMLARRERASLVDAVDYLELHALCRAHGRERVAIQWLERGLKAFPDDARLIDVLAQERQAEGFGDEALALVWRSFETSLDPARFLQLRELAADGDWPGLRARALEHVRRHQEQPDEALARLHLAEGDADALAALVPDARFPLAIWMEVMQALAPDYPELALRAGRVVVRHSVESGHKRAYVQAVMWLRQMQVLHLRIGDASRFHAYLDWLRAEYGAKRSFIALLHSAFQA